MQKPHCNACSAEKDPLERVGLAVGSGQSFHGPYRAALALHGQHEAGPDGLAVHQHRAGPADAVFAAHAVRVPVTPVVCTPAPAPPPPAAGVRPWAPLGYEVGRLVDHGGAGGTEVRDDDVHPAGGGASGH
ncbi:hypothetical protein A6P39_007570 [Streptomyces sp. FXJ1.172]|uniref:hypothetical protein n=1 Tax=Streptomyces sp. FXJ1.172 TaxID=710705 RepID=UPI0023DD4509|nr:hypothetical protein [Streptomyces sp. FXJ1.172]WEO93878.1 hypothetical protein A6P39_007570 [Streptomyces sp. FXJ1.172]